jgi:valyl-tRNA synthetase
MSDTPQIPEQDFSGAEADFDLAFSCIKSARSISASYSLPTNGKTVEDKITGACWKIWLKFS